MTPFRYSRRRTDTATKSFSQNGLFRNSNKVKRARLMLISVLVLVKQDSPMDLRGSVILTQCHKTLNEGKRNKLVNRNHAVQCRVEITIKAVNIDFKVGNPIMINTNKHRKSINILFLI
jgi:hypothetical protein